MSTRTTGPLPGDAALPLANERLKGRARDWFWGGLAAATLVHFLLFVLGPALTIEEFEPAGSSVAMQALDLQDAASTTLLRSRIALPAPPQRIEVPALPIAAAAAELPEDITIAPTTLFEELPVGAEIPLPPTPAGAAEELRGFEHFMPYMVKPELKNRREVRRALERNYPPALQVAGVQGELLVWFWIDETGAVQKYEIKRSSGIALLDDAAERVIELMEFSPALDRGEPIRVIVALPIRFEVE